MATDATPQHRCATQSKPPALQAIPSSSQQFAVICFRMQAFFFSLRAQTVNACFTATQGRVTNFKTDLPLSVRLWGSSSRTSACTIERFLMMQTSFLLLLQQQHVIIEEFLQCRSSRSRIRKGAAKTPCRSLVESHTPWAKPVYAGW